ncbi:response regulator transcription factor [Rhizobium sp. P44RR-XXIV]|uniref:winged helix-turn-helix transcriptional regulator n=1 Tax=Rhizobium sp. P44RR-XXIV TaxID=1921145 RepID=UPI000985A910|nr:response regulator transcription factor [Rhizobium sp. P44RR-XXIV]TIX92779.1 response regulator transcription factor [Rhizobium sp. P44RR-XXIV]
MDFRILVHSRNAQMFLLLQHVLAIESFSVSLSASMEDAANELHEESVRAIIIDHSACEARLGDVATLKAMRGEIAIALLCNQSYDSPDMPFDETGADLVLARPFDPAQLINFLRRLRLEALIANGGAVASADVLRFADLEMNSATFKVRRNGRDVPLTALQFRLLRYLLQNPEAVRSREQLIAAAWPEDSEVEPRTVDIHMGHIRRALRKLGPDLIRTVRTRGYALGIYDCLEK